MLQEYREEAINIPEDSGFLATSATSKAFMLTISQKGPPSTANL